MAAFLVLRLRGPLMSFGGVAVDERRPTNPLPGLSLLTGLVANALGLRSRDGALLDRLQERLVFGARQDDPGEVIVDLQNAHIQKGQAMWRTRTLGPLVRAGGEYENLQRWRHYVADGAVTVVLGLDPAEEEPTLSAISEALTRPARPLFLGRIGCPPSVFMHLGERVEAGSVPEALSLVPALDGPKGPRLAEWPGEGPWAGDGADALRIEDRYDLRDWVNDLHAGRRLVAAGRITPPDGGAGEG